MPEFDSTVSYRDVLGFPGYKVGSDGSVWSCWKWGGRESVFCSSWRRKAQRLDRKGRPAISIRLSKKLCTRPVHRLVLEAFVGPCPPGMECCHEDGIKTNNNLSNLRWDTHASNIADRHRHGTTARGSKAGKAKLTESGVAVIRRRLSAGESQVAVAGDYGVDQTTVSDIWLRRTWCHVE